MITITGEIWTLDYRVTHHVALFPRCCLHQNKSCFLVLKHYPCIDVNKT